MLYDVIILGGGPGGYMAAEKAGEAGLKTLLIEKEHIGGTCLHEGCIPAKILLHSAKIYDHCSKHSKSFGVRCSSPTISLEAVAARKNAVIKTLTDGLQSQLKQKNVEVLIAEGMVTGKTPHGYQVTSMDTVYEGKNLLIATGSVPVIPPIEGLQESLENGFAVTSKEILELTNKPESLAIIGAGIIGLEFASFYNSLGTKVTVLEQANKIAGAMDAQLVQALQQEYSRRGVRFILGAQVTGVHEGGVIYRLNGKEAFEECDTVLLCVGRRAFADKLGLEHIGAIVEHGVLATDGACRTNLSGLYAIGDVNGRSMLAHTAYREADCVVSLILGQEDSVDYNTIPSVIYTNPEAATVGYNEETAPLAGYHDIETVVLPMGYSGRFVAEGTTSAGLCKIIFDRQNQTMIGAHCMSSYASEFISVCTQLIELKIPLERMKKLVFPHPTMCEIIREAIHTMKSV